MKRFACWLLCAALLLLCAGAASAEEGASSGTLFDGVAFSEKSAEGFIAPVPDGWSSRSVNDASLVAYRSGRVSGCQVEYFVYWYPSESPYHYAEDPAVAEEEIRDDFAKVKKGAHDAAEEYIDLDGHPAGLLTWYITGKGGRFEAWCGRIAYVRNTRYLMIDLYVIGNDPEQTPRITMDDLKFLAGKIGYDESQAPFTAAMATFSIAGKAAADEITAGKALQMEAVFDASDVINKKEKNDGILWSVVNAETGAKEPLASVSDKGQLKVDKSLGAPMELEVRGTSVAYGTQAACKVKAFPVVTGVTVEPAELFFYVGTDDPQEVKASLIPGTMPPDGVTWTPAKEGIVEIVPAEGGTVSVRPLAAGKIKVKVAEKNGKNAVLTVSVVPPVESLELAVKGNPKPGGSVTVSAALAPKEAGNKNVEWSLDVGEEIAVINEKGQVKIGKEAPSGTKITVTCKALGAPEPLTASVEIEIP